MYSVDDRDKVVELSNVPAAAVSSPKPVVLGDRGRLLLAYVASEPEPEWDIAAAHVATPAAHGRPIAVVQFTQPLAHFFGPPSDESLSGHPLAKRGLEPYSICEVQESSWMRALETIDAMRRGHNPAAFASKRHFIFAFRDCTFEAVADDVEASVHRGDIDAMVEKLANMVRM